MNPANHLARRYHWHSTSVRGFVSDPHTAILGQPQGTILNLVDARAANAQQTLLTTAAEPVISSLQEARKLTMPSRDDVQSADIDLKRLGAVLAVAHEKELRDFTSLLLVEGLDTLVWSELGQGNRMKILYAREMSFERARLESCRKFARKVLGFSPRGKVLKH